MELILEDVLEMAVLRSEADYEAWSKAPCDTVYPPEKYPCLGLQTTDGAEWTSCVYLYAEDVELMRQKLERKP